MKKTLLLALSLLLLAAAAHAQRWSFDDESDSKDDWFGVDLGVGGMKDLDGTGIDFGLRYLHEYTKNIAWDAVSLKAVANTEDFGATITPQLMTGIRLTSPGLLKDMAVFGGFKAGYGYNVDGEEGGFCYEVEAGLKINRHLFVGYAYNNQKLGGGNVKYSAFRIGFNL